jgi:hypothetical protein
MDNDLVRGSSRLFSVGTHFIFASFISLIYQIKWNFLSNCLNHWWDIGLFAYAMAPLLSLYKVTGLTMLGTNLLHWWTSRFKQPICFLKCGDVLLFSCRINYALLFENLLTQSTTI